MLKFYKSFRYALNGLITLIKTERNFRIMAVVCIIVNLLGFGLDALGEHLNRYEWAILGVAM
jgi:diacylglycerol kinase